MKYQNARRVRRGLWLCALAAGAACSGGSESAPPPVPPAPTAASAPAVTATTVEPAPSSVPYPQFDEDVEVRVRFIAYGDVDPNDDIAFGVIPDLQIAVINDRKSSEWWNTVGGEVLGEQTPGSRMFIPPGAQMQSTAEAITASPINFVTTGPDGTAETYLNPLKPSRSFSICVISPIDDLIAGCSLKEWIRPEAINEERISSEALNEWRDPTIFYIYFSNGRAYIDQELDGSERYYRFLHGDRDLYSPSAEPATVTFVSTAFPNELNNSLFEDKYLAPGAQVAVINDSDIGAWWDAVSDNGKYPLYAIRGVESGWDIPYDRAVRERVRKNALIRTVVIGWPGITEVDLSPGDYLFCDLRGLDEDNYAVISSCTYTDIAAARDYIFEVNYGVFELSDKGRKLIEDSKNWEFEP